MKNIRYVPTLLAILCAPFALHGQQQLLPNEAAAIEAAWASAPRLLNIPIPVRRGFDKDAPFENITTDVTGIGRTNTKHWERIEIHLPRFLAVDHVACLMVNSKCRALPVGASLDRKNSILYWHVPNAYKGDFDLVFFQPGSGIGAIRVTTGFGSKYVGL